MKTMFQKYIMLKELQKIKGLTRIHYDGTYYTVEFSADQDLRSNITGAITKNNWTLLSVESVALSLEDVFLKLTTEEEDVE